MTYISTVNSHPLMLLLFLNWQKPQWGLHFLINILCVCHSGEHWKWCTRHQKASAKNKFLHSEVNLLIHQILGKNQVCKERGNCPPVIKVSIMSKSLTQIFLRAHFWELMLWRPLHCLHKMVFFLYFSLVCILAYLGSLVSCIIFMYVPFLIDKDLHECWTFSINF